MFGNRLGWIFAGAELAVVGLVAFLFTVKAGALTPPTSDYQPGSVALAAIALPTEPEAVLTAMSGSCDAADLYRQAIEAYRRSPAVYNQAAQNASSADPAKLPALDFLLKATPCLRMTLFSSNPAGVINYESERPQIEALRVLGEACANAGVLVATRDRKSGMRYMEAAFSLGAKMYHERAVYQEFFDGMGLMGKAGTALSRLYEKNGDTSMAKQLKAFDESRMEYYNKRIAPTWRIISSIDDKVIARHAGDVFALAHNSQDRMWRVEATLKLGRYRFNAGRSGDQRGAMREVRKMAEDPAEDPAVKAAAAAARDMTLEQYHMLR